MVVMLQQNRCDQRFLFPNFTIKVQCAMSYVMLSLCIASVINLNSTLSSICCSNFCIITPEPHLIGGNNLVNSYRSIWRCPFRWYQIVNSLQVTCPGVKVFNWKIKIDPPAIFSTCNNFVFHVFRIPKLINQYYVTKKEYSRWQDWQKYRTSGWRSYALSNVGNGLL